MVRNRLCAVGWALLSVPPLAFANVTDLPRTGDEISIDGLLDEPAWQDALRIDIDKETGLPR